MDNRKTIVSSALNVAGDALKFGIGLGALGVSKLNSALRGAISNGSEAVKSASATVGSGIHDAREATGHVAEAAEALIVEFGQSFKGQAGVPADEANGKTIEAVANPVKPAAGKAKAATKSTAKAKPAAKTATKKAAAKPAVKKAAPAKPKAGAKNKAAAPARTTVSEAKPMSVDATPTTEAKAATKPAASKKAAAKKATGSKPGAPKKAANKPDVQAATSMTAEQTPPTSKLH